VRAGKSKTVRKLPPNPFLFFRHSPRHYSDSDSDGVFDTVTARDSTGGETGSQKAWALDAVGNWKSTTTYCGSAISRTNNAQNQLTNIGTRQSAPRVILISRTTTSQ